MYVSAYVTTCVIDLPRSQLLLHIFAFDDARGFQALGSAINLHPWYNGAVTICLACFVSGSEELVLVDSQAQTRVFSLVTLQFRCVWSWFLTSTRVSLMRDGND